MNRLEVLIINDGSKDTSSAIAHEYQDKYPQTFRVIDKENGNYGSCVNRGLKEAKGKYVKVLDADDSFDNDLFPTYLDFLASQDADMVINNYVCVNGKGRVTQTVKSFDNGHRVEQPFKDLVNEYPFIDIHMLAFKTTLFEGKNFHQSERIFYSDNEFAYIPTLWVNTYSFIGIPLYRYLVGRGEQTVSYQVSTKRFNDYKIVAFVLMESCLKLKADELHKSFLQNKVAGYISNLYALRCSDYFDLKEFEEFDDKLKKDYPFFYKLTENVPSPFFKVCVTKKWRADHSITPLRPRFGYNHPTLNSLYYWLWFLPKYEFMTKVLHRKSNI